MTARRSYEATISVTANISLVAASGWTAPGTCTRAGENLLLPPPAETLMVIMRHKSFATTKKFYAASRAAQSAAAEVHQQLGSDVDLNAFVGRIIKVRRQLDGGPFP